MVGCVQWLLGWSGLSIGLLLLVRLLVTWMVRWFVGNNHKMKTFLLFLTLSFKRVKYLTKTTNKHLLQQQ